MTKKKVKVTDNQSVDTAKKEPVVDMGDNEKAVEVVDGQEVKEEGNEGMIKSSDLSEDNEAVIEEVTKSQVDGNEDEKQEVIPVADVSPMINRIKNLEEQNGQLKEENEALSKEVDSLYSQNKSLQSTIDNLNAPKVNRM